MLLSLDTFEVYAFEHAAHKLVAQVEGVGVGQNALHHLAPTPRLEDGQIVALFEHTYLLRDVHTLGK